MQSPLPRYITTVKAVGETPLLALERLRRERNIPPSVPLAYAGRLDPMASGQLLILVGDECKVQERYHSLDKEYVFEVLLGVGSDTHDVLGIVTRGTAIHPTEETVRVVLENLTGTITLPYPHFSSKTVEGKPLHTWALEGKLGDIAIPTKTSRIHSLTLTSVRTLRGVAIHAEVMEKIATIPTVRDPRKALGRDFRRTEVRESWNTLIEGEENTEYTILTLRCIASSGTYMRTLASTIGEKLGTTALAYSIDRTRIGRYLPIPFVPGIFIKTYAP
jgi:tRNA pseudouridine(55) synthase